ncbi:hypothetical protein Agabi119p4_4949 [Agaricus bisporus var. burnettii]|uniref:Uncharacterized protein n=1 Tax=Agaricus bisporus var. burnettii TaxID=192524 RepID=A0A8H7F479_AGABI|nr:hypothetical protein Agabi119p4_4949 [Agaricus bisporus var. burnettii]
MWSRIKCRVLTTSFNGRGSDDSLFLRRPRNRSSVNIERIATHGFSIIQIPSPIRITPADQLYPVIIQIS